MIAALPVSLSVQRTGDANFLFSEIGPDTFASFQTSDNNLSEALANSPPGDSRNEAVGYFENCSMPKGTFCIGGFVAQDSNWLDLIRNWIRTPGFVHPDGRKNQGVY
jgi:hypothetical protein